MTNDPKITLLAWIDIRAQKPPTSTCLFTDGVSFWTGWWSGTDQRIYVNAGPRLPHGVLELSEVHSWAKLNNLVPILKGGA